MAKKNKWNNNSKNKNSTAKKPEEKLNEPIIPEEKPAADNTPAPEKPQQEEKPAPKSKRRKQPGAKPEKPAPKEHKEHETILSSLAGALDEDYSEIEEVMSPQQPSETTKTKYPVSQKIFFCVGVFILAMAIVGIVSTVNFTANFIGEIADQTSLKNEFAVFVYPVVASDPPAFENIEDLPSSTIINCSIWQIVLSGNTEN